jgi:hypothetical protein
VIRNACVAIILWTKDYAYGFADKIGFRIPADDTSREETSLKKRHAFQIVEETEIGEQKSNNSS